MSKTVSTQVGNLPFVKWALTCLISKSICGYLDFQSSASVLKMLKQCARQESWYNQICAKQMQNVASGLRKTFHFPLVWKAKHMQGKFFTRLPTCSALFYIEIKFPPPLPDFLPALFSLPSFASKDGNYYHLHIGSRIKSASYLFPKLCPCSWTYSSLKLQQGVKGKDVFKLPKGAQN